MSENFVTEQVRFRNKKHGDPRSRRLGDEKLPSYVGSIS